jgi:hypothetical protein
MNGIAASFVPGIRRSLHKIRGCRYHGVRQVATDVPLANNPPCFHAFFESQELQNVIGGCNSRWV